MCEMDKRVAYVLVPALEGGWIVKEHNPQQYETGLLFAGDAEAVLLFLVKRLAAVDDVGWENVAKIGQL